MSDSSNDCHLKVGSLAAAAGVGLGTVRYYQKLGLLPKPKKPKLGGFRKYSKDDVNLLLLIKNTQAFGFTLKEIGLIVAHRDNKDCHAVRGLIVEREKAIKQQISTQEANLKSLIRLAKCCDGQCGDNCRLFENLATTNLLGS
jgi:MerR family mercuric resistance operon transcriptional regulator